MAKRLLEKQVPERTYEVTYLVNSGLTTSELAGIRDEVATLVGKHQGKIQETQDWGKKELAYTIKNEGRSLTEAIYTHLIVNMSADKVDALARALELKKGIIRSLIVVATPVKENKETK